MNAECRGTAAGDKAITSEWPQGRGRRAQQTAWSVHIPHRPHRPHTPGHSRSHCVGLELQEWPHWSRRLRSGQRPHGTVREDASSHPCPPATLSSKCFFPRWRNIMCCWKILCQIITISLIWVLILKRYATIIWEINLCEIITKKGRICKYYILTTPTQQSC